MDDGSFEAFDDEDPDSEIITPAAGDMRQWEFDVGTFGRMIQGANAFDGGVARVNPRLWFLGQATRDGRKEAIVLGLFERLRDSDISTIRTLPTRLPEHYHPIYLVSPLVELSAIQQRELEAYGVRIASFDFESFRIDLASAFDDRLPTKRIVILNDEEEEQFARYQFKSRALIGITGRRAARARNVVLLDDRIVPLPNSEFRCFFRLVFENLKGEDGYVTLSQLRRGDGEELGFDFFPAGIEQAISRLRSHIQPALTPPMTATDLIERNAGRVRLSTYKKYVGISETLSHHPDSAIKRLASLLNATTKHNPRIRWLIIRRSGRNRMLNRSGSLYGKIRPPAL